MVVSPILSRPRSRTYKHKHSLMYTSTYLPTYQPTPTYTYLSIPTYSCTITPNSSGTPLTEKGILPSRKKTMQNNIPWSISLPGSQDSLIWVTFIRTNTGLWCVGVHYNTCRNYARMTQDLCRRCIYQGSSHV